MFLGQNNKDTLILNHRVVSHNVFNVKLFKLLEPRSFYSHQSLGTSIIYVLNAAYTKQTKYNAPVKRKDLK
jgi:hypothetical protein